MSSADHRHTSVPAPPGSQAARDFLLRLPGSFPQSFRAFHRSVPLLLALEMSTFFSSANTPVPLSCRDGALGRSSAQVHPPTPAGAPDHQPRDPVGEDR